MNAKNTPPKPTDDINQVTEGALDGATCSAFRFSFSATYPKEHNRVGGTFLEGDLELDNLDDLPHAALAIFQNAIADWDMTGQTEMRFSILPNASDDRQLPGSSTPESTQDLNG